MDWFDVFNLTVVTLNGLLCLFNLFLWFRTQRYRRWQEAYLAQAEAKITASQELARAVKGAGAAVPEYLRDMAREILP